MKQRAAEAAVTELYTIIDSISYTLSVNVPGVNNPAEWIRGDEKNYWSGFGLRLPLTLDMTFAEDTLTWYCIDPLPPDIFSRFKQPTAIPVDFSNLSMITPTGSFHSKVTVIQELLKKVSASVFLREDREALIAKIAQINDPEDILIHRVEPVLQLNSSQKIFETNIFPDHCDCDETVTEIYYFLPSHYHQQIIEAAKSSDSYKPGDFGFTTS